MGSQECHTGDDRGGVLVLKAYCIQLSSGVLGGAESMIQQLYTKLYGW